MKDRICEPDDRVVSTEDYDSHAEALAAARRAYPDALVDPEGASRSHTRSPAPAEGGGAAEKIAQWLALIVVLIAWSRRNRGDS